MISVISKAFKWFGQFRLSEIDSFKKTPIDAQEKVFRELIRRGKSTAWGEKYHYIEIGTIEDFQNTVPLNDYEDLFTSIDQMMNGERDILWPGLTKNFSKSSGTTARSKYIPVTKESLSSMYKASKDQLVLYIENNPDTRILEGKSIFVGGTLDKVREDPEIFCGDVSAILMKNLPALGEYWRTPSLETALMADFEPKLEKLADEAVNENVTSIAGVPTWTLALLKKVLEKAGKEEIHEVWPNLEVFFHGAMSFEPYRNVFNAFIKEGSMNYMEVYNASEGFFAVQDDPSLHGEMLLLPDCGVFYEFVRMQDLGKKDATAYTMANVELGVNYAMIISTNGGLWRYIIGDTVEFTSLNPHRIKITGRTKHFINAFGEEVMVHNTDLAIKHASEKTGALITDYTVAPVFMGEGESGRHQWIIEFEKKPEDLQKFADILDTELRTINSDYDAKRHKDIILSRLELRVVPQGTFYEWMKSRGKLGGQHKVPRLSNDRKYVDEIMKLL